MARRVFRWNVLVVVLGLALISLSSARAFAADESPVEYKLAVIQIGGYVAPDDPLVQAYARVLDRVQPRCTETRIQLGSIALALTDQLEKEGVSTATPLSLLAGLDTATAPDVFGTGSPTSCAQVLGLLAYLASQGE